MYVFDSLNRSSWLSVTRAESEGVPEQRVRDGGRGSDRPVRIVIGGHPELLSREGRLAVED